MSGIGKFLTTVVFLGILGGIGAADAYVMRDELPLIVPVISGGSSSDGGTDNPDVPEPAGTAKSDGPDIQTILLQRQFDAKTTSETSLVQRILPADVTAETRVLLQNNDRVAFIAWVETPDAKAYMQALKESLYNSFSSDVEDLRDETEFPEDGPVRNILSFRDPSIHEEKLIFIRVRERLYELHVAEDKGALVDTLIVDLTK